MGRKVYVVGVGMTKFEKPGRGRAGTTPTWRSSPARRPWRTRDPVQRDRAGVRRLRVRRVHLRAARRLRPRAHRHPGLQRQQQLLHRLDRAVHGASSSSRAGMADCVLALGFEKMAKGSLGSTFSDRTHPDGQAHDVDDGDERLRPGTACGADLRQRRPRAHGALRHHARALRQDRATRTTSTRRATPTRSSRTSTRSSRSRPHRWCSSRSPSCSAARPRTAPPPRSSAARTSSSATVSKRRRSRSSAWR